ncbi:MAG TPA: hypothetical protein VF574_12175 [Allosphingosinicella sp.]|jgi:hypothetical protein
MIAAAAGLVVAATGVVVVQTTNSVPLFGREGECGPAVFSVEEVIKGWDKEERHRLSLPIRSAEPAVNDYMNEAARNLIGHIKSRYSGNLAKTGEPLKVQILFARDEYRTFGLGPGSTFGRFGDRVWLSSPWVRISTNNWRPCSMRVTFLYSGRQVIRDQIEMSGKKRIIWPHNSQFSEKAFRKWSELYRDMITKDYNNEEEYLKANRVVERDIPPEIYWLFADSTPKPLGGGLVIENWSGAPYRIQDILEKSAAGYARLSNQVVEDFFKDTKRRLNFESVVDLNYSSLGYKLNRSRYGVLSVSDESQSR